MSEKMIQISPERIREARGSMSQTDLSCAMAALLGEPVSAAAVSAWERGVCEPGSSLFGALCAATGKDPNFFYGLPVDGLTINSDRKS